MKCHVYILTDPNNTVLYTGVTSDLKERLKQHKSKKHVHSFTARYNIFKLGYFEEYAAITEAINREKQIKGGSRKKKVDLISAVNPGWIDLSDYLAD